MILQPIPVEAKKSEVSGSANEDTDSDDSVKIVSIGSYDKDSMEAIDSEDDSRIVYCECYDCGETRQDGRRSDKTGGQISVVSGQNGRRVVGTTGQVCARCTSGGTSGYTRGGQAAHTDARTGCEMN